MLELNITGGEFLDEETSRLIHLQPTTIRLEHSLLSLSKWEARYERPFIDKPPATREEIMYYIRCMTVDDSVDPTIYYAFSPHEIEQVKAYLSSKQTATVISDLRQPTKRGRRSAITSEVVYYWMFIRGIPIECERWFLNRLLTLIRVYDVNDAGNGKGGRMNKRQTAAWMQQQNRLRRAQLNSKG